MLIYLDIVEQFVCRQCGTCCRRDWLVTVDEAGYRRNERLFGGLDRLDEFRQAFIPLQDGADFGEYARLNKRVDGACWFLTANNLCRLQQMAGHEHLDAVCQCFPRYPMDTERGVELSLSFSCPAALRLAMREEPLRVLRREYSPLTAQPGDFVVCAYPGQQPAHSPLRYYFELEGHLIDVLQERRLPLTQRLRFVRRTLSALMETGREDPAERQARLINGNYNQIDAVIAAGKVTAETGPRAWLAENFFINYIFRKNIYAHGLRQAANTLEALAKKLRPFLEPGPAHGQKPNELAETIVGLEVELNHRARCLPQADNFAADGRNGVGNVELK